MFRWARDIGTFGLEKYLANNNVRQNYAIVAPKLTACKKENRADRDTISPKKIWISFNLMALWMVSMVAPLTDLMNLEYRRRLPK